MPGPEVSAAGAAGTVGFRNPPGWPEPAPGLWPGPEHLAYRAIRLDLTEVLTDHPVASALPVPACPGWTIHDVLAHLVRVCESGAGGPETGPVPPVTATVPELLRRWAVSAVEVEPAIAAGVRPRSPILVMDAFCHELDVLHTLGRPVPPLTHPAWAVAFHVVTTGISRSIAEHQQAAVRIEAPSADWVVGPGEPVAVLRGSHHGLMRALTGRRSPDQIAALDWSADPAPWIPSFQWGPFLPPARPAIEAEADI